MEKDVALAKGCLDRVDRARLTAEQSQMFKDIEDLLRTVTKAQEEDDIAAAARLARKARLLAEDLAAR